MLIMRALIVDDEAPARAKIRRLLESSVDVEIVGEAATGREAIAGIKRARPDVVFLDIQMPGLDGFGVVDALESDGGPFFVFVTANDQHALRAFEIGAVDYLLKPFTPARFDQVLERARERLAPPRSNSPISPSRPFLKRLLVIDNGHASFVPVEQIDRVESDRNYVRIICGADEHRLRTPIGSLQDRLDPSHFLRINRSTLVRLDAVRVMNEWSHGDFQVIMRDGTELIWSRRYRDAAEREFGIGD
jgi:two-component system, LytTR family, response regulator